MNLIVFNFLTCLVITFVITPTVSGLQSGSSPCIWPRKEKVHYLPVSQKKQSWLLAYAMCRLADMKLASIKSAAEETAVEAAINKVSNKNGYDEGYWIAGAWEGGDYIWPKTMETIGYRKFHPSQSDHDGNNNTCLEIYFDNPNSIFWNGLDCNKELNYVCEYTTCRWDTA